MSTTSEYLSVDQVAEVLHLSPGTIYQYTSKRRIPFIKFGGKLLFEWEEIKEWLHEHRQEVRDA